MDVPPIPTQRFGGGVQLAEPAVDQHQAGHFLLSVLGFVFLDTLVTSCHNLAHGSEIVDANYVADNEFAVV